MGRIDLPTWNGPFSCKFEHVGKYTHTNWVFWVHVSVFKSKPFSPIKSQKIGKQWLNVSTTKFMIGTAHMNYMVLPGWWFRPIWKIWSSKWKSSPKFGVKMNKNIWVANNQLRVLCGFDAAGIVYTSINEQITTENWCLELGGWPCLGQPKGLFPGANRWF